MQDFDDFDRKSFRKQKINSKKKYKKIVNNIDEDHKTSKIKHEYIKRKIQDLQEEELWEDWENWK